MEQWNNYMACTSMLMKTGWKLVSQQADTAKKASNPLQMSPTPTWRWYKKVQRTEFFIFPTENAFVFALYQHPSSAGESYDPDSAPGSYRWSVGLQTKICDSFKDATIRALSLVGQCEDGPGDFTLSFELSPDGA